MKDSLTKDYHQGLKTLEDIRSLGGNELNPLINRAYYHLSEVKRKAQESLGQTDSFKRVRKLLESIIDQYLKKYLFEQNSISQISIIKDYKSFDLRKWDLLLESIGNFIKVAGFFKFKSDLIFTLSDEKLSLTGIITNSANIQKKREQIYAISRHFLRLNSLLTYGLSETDKLGEYQFTLNLDLSHNEEQIYIIDLTKEKGILLGLSNTLSNYTVPLESRSAIGKCFCLEIKESLEIEKYYHIPERESEEFEGKEILTFPFLFRPVSIIIPKRGRLISHYGLHQLGDTGSVNSQTEHDVYRIQDFHYKYIDFFNLLA